MTMLPVEVNTPLEPPPPWDNAGLVSAQQQLANTGKMVPYTQSGVLIPAGRTTSETIDIVTDSSMETQLVLVVDVTAVTVGETLTVQINGKTASGAIYPILTSAALSAVAVTTLRVGMSFTPVANLSANDMLPNDLQVVCTVAGTGTTVTYGVDVVIG